MKNLRKIMTRLIIVISVLCIYQRGIRFLYEDYKATVIYTNYDRQQLEGSIETLVLGTSTAQRAFETSILNEELDTISFNMASGVQPLDGSYALLKDVDKSNPIKRLFLSVTPQSMEKTESSIMAKTLVYDRLSRLDSKLAYLIYGCSLKEVPYLTMYSVRVEDYTDLSMVRENVSAKLSEEFKRGETHKKSYRGNGRIAWKKVYNPEENLSEQISVKSFKADAHQQKYLEKILKYCKEQEIEVILTLLPQKQEELSKYEDMTQIDGYFAELSEKYQVCYWNYNLYQEGTKLFTNEMFHDVKHLNKQGGDIFTREFAMMYNKLHSGENVEKLFIDPDSYVREEE